MSSILDIPFNEGKQEGFAEAKENVMKQKIMIMIEREYPKEQIMTLFDEADEEIYNECKKNVDEGIHMDDIFKFVFEKGKREGFEEGRNRYCGEIMTKMMESNYTLEEIKMLFGDEPVVFN